MKRMQRVRRMQCFPGAAAVGLLHCSSNSHSDSKTRKAAIVPDAVMNLRHKRAGVVASLLAAALAIMAMAATARAAPVTIVALGASNTYGKGVARNEAYPAQLEAMLRGRGIDARVVNAGVNGETTGAMLNRLDSAVPDGTRLVIFQPGGNDDRKGVGADRAHNIALIQSKLAGRGIKVILSENAMLRGLPHQPDRQHLTPEGYRMLAAALLPQVEAAIGH
jgi:acyl-CoA thioesterase I